MADLHLHFKSLEGRPGVLFIEWLVFRTVSELNWGFLHSAQVRVSSSTCACNSCHQFLTLPLPELDLLALVPLAGAGVPLSYPMRGTRQEGYSALAEGPTISGLLFSLVDASVWGLESLGPLELLYPRTKSRATLLDRSHAQFSCGNASHPNTIFAFPFPTYRCHQHYHRWPL